MRRVLLLNGLIAVLGLTAAGLPNAVQAQSFDCANAETETEWAICNTPELSKRDEKMVSYLKRLRAAEKRNPSISREGEQLQKAWIVWERNQCDGNVGCLIKAYDDVLSVLKDHAISAETLDPPTDKLGTIAPNCDTPLKTDDPAKQYNSIVCGNKSLLATAQQADAIAREIRPKLKPSWRTALDTAQNAFPNTPNMCPPGKTESCVAKAVNDRLKDLKAFANNFDKLVPDCKPSEVSIKDSGVGDAGMSQTLTAYLIEYKGSGTCRLQGYPSAIVIDEKGKEQPGFVDYSADTYFSSSAAPPLPVFLSQSNRTAWFAIHSAHACDGMKPQAREAKLALPRSRAWLHTIEFSEATCKTVNVTPIEPISTLYSES